MTVPWILFFFFLVFPFKFQTFVMTPNTEVMRVFEGAYEFQRKKKKQHENTSIQTAS